MYIAKLSELLWAIFVQCEEHMLDCEPYAVILLFHGTSSLSQYDPTPPPPSPSEVSLSLQ